MGLGKAAEAGGGQESQLRRSGPQEQEQLSMAKDTVFLVSSPQEECSRQGLKRGLGKVTPGGACAQHPGPAAMGIGKQTHCPGSQCCSINPDG